MGRFAAAGNAVLGTNVTALVIGGGTTVKAAIYDLTFSCGSTPADQQFTWTVRRTTTLGTTTAETPEPLDPDAPAAIATAGKSAIAGAEPTYAGIATLEFGLHQRAVYRWVARERGEIITSKTASNGVGASVVITSGTPTARVVAHWFE
mgnify:CR=1 FL=1